MYLESQVYHKGFVDGMNGQAHKPDVNEAAELKSAYEQGFYDGFEIGNRIAEQCYSAWATEALRDELGRLNACWNVGGDFWTPFERESRNVIIDILNKRDAIEPGDL